MQGNNLRLWMDLNLYYPSLSILSACMIRIHCYFMLTKSQTSIKIKTSQFCTSGWDVSRMRKLILVRLWIGWMVLMIQFIVFGMERKVSPSSLEQRAFNIKSSFISQDKTTQLTSRKQLSSSTFLDLEESKAKFTAHRKLSRKETEYLPHADQLIRARSLKNIEDPKFKSLQVIEGQQLGSLNESTLRLKAEELLFKLKVRFGSLLREVGVNEEEVSRFSQLGKVDEIILFVSEKVRHGINEATRIASSTSTSNTKDRDVLEKTQAQLEMVRGKLTERQNSERTYKAKLKESHAELKELYDKVNVKEKEYSQKTTELYQLKVQMKEQEKAAEMLKNKLQAIEKQRNELKNMLDNAGKDHSGALQSLKQEKQQLTMEVSELKEELERAKQRTTKLQELNQHLNEQLTRWRQRVDFDGERQSEREKSSEEAPHTPNNDLVGISLQELKKSTMSMNSAYINNFNSSVRVQSLTALEIDNTRLKLQLAELQKDNQQLHRTILNYAPNKFKYEQALQSTEVAADLSRGLDGKKLDYLKERSGELYRVEVESHYKRKTEQIAREWKDKLYEIVCKYEDQIQLLKNDINTLKHDRQQADKKLYALANEKYQTQTKLIELERQLYSITNRSSKSLLSYAHAEQIHSVQKQSQGKSSEEVIPSNPRLLPIQEQDSPTRPRHEDPGDNLSVFSIKEEENANLQNVDQKGEVRD